MNIVNDIPIKTAHLFPAVNSMLIELLQSLTEKEWNKPTIAKLWTVKDIASHLLDGGLRSLSSSRDNFFGEKAENTNSYSDLVSFLNKLNMDWTNATKRLSPQVLISLLEITNKQFVEHLATLNPFDNAVYSVAWAGQEVSANWFHIAREYTERFLHQQQIRDAVGKQALLTKELYYPFIDTLMYGLPHTYRNTIATTGTLVSVIVNGEIGGQWNIQRNEIDWALIKTIEREPAATIKIDPYDAWKLFTKGMKPEEAINKVDIKGDVELGRVALQMISVMA